MLTSGPQTASHADTAVLNLYETFPYPPPVAGEEYVRAIAAGKKGHKFGLAEAFYSYFPESARTDDLDVLVAGCGTTLGTSTAASLPGARVVAIDISQASLDRSAALAAKSGVHNIEHHRLPLERIGELRRSFDYVVATGVLHHLASPEAGLAALRDVLRPGGAMCVMLYGAHGRTGVYMLQELFQLLGAHADAAGTQLVNRLLPCIPAEHPIHQMGVRADGHLPDEEVADMLLHPRDRPFTVDSVRELLDAAGVKLHRWLGQSNYRPENTPLSGPDWSSSMAARTDWQRARAVELFRGNMGQHWMVLTHPNRPSADELLEGDAILQAVPVLYKNLDIRREGDEVTIRNLWLGTEPVFRAEAGPLASVLRAIDGRSTIVEILNGDSDGPVDSEQLGRAAMIFRSLWRADVIDFAIPSSSEPV